MKKSRIIIIAFLWLVLWTSSNAQQSAVIESISFEGLRRTKLSYVRQLVQAKVGATFSQKDREKDEQILRRLSGIGNAELRVDTLRAGGLELTYEITEQKTFLPILGIGGIQDNFWYILGGAEHNLFGKNQVLLGYYLSNDGLANGQIYYRNNRFAGSRWGYVAEFRHAASLEPLYFETAAVNYRYQNTGGGLAGIYNIDPNRLIELGANFFIEKYDKQTDGNPDDLPGPNQLNPKKLLTKITFQSNHTTYDYFYRGGYLWQALLQNVVTFGESTGFTSLTVDGIKYWHPVRSVNLAARVRFGISNNRPSPFAPFVLDSQVNIRGVGNRVDRGTAQLVINLEYRQTFFESGSWAGQAVLFSDLGTWRNPGGRLKDLADVDQFRHFVGGGLRLVNNRIFSAIFRIDYGVDIYNTNERGFVVGMGQYF